MTNKQQKLSFYCPLFTSIKDDKLMFSEKLDKDDQGLFRGLETILLPQSEVSYQNLSDGLLQITSPSYPQKVCYSFEPFLNFHASASDVRDLKKGAELIERLIHLVGLPYVWGGSAVLTSEQKNQIDHTFKNYPSSFRQNLHYLFSGLDCSGLLHYVTGGITPRNTSELIDFGTSVLIEESTIDEILSKVQPLDLLVWKGHIVIFLSKNEIIESRLGFGVVKTNAKDRLIEVTQNKRPVNLYQENSFVIRRMTCFL